jgi:hypothetical protein
VTATTPPGEGGATPLATATASHRPASTGLLDVVRPYFAVDRRLLGAFRIYFGGVLLYDLLRRVPYLTVLYSNDGVLPNHTVLFAPQASPQFSIFFPFSTPAQVSVAFALTGLVYLLYTVGCFTRVMQVLVLVCATSLNNRNTFLEDGGVVTMNLLAIFTLLLPLGDRYSLDAVRRRFQLRRDPAVDQSDEGPQLVISTWMLAVTLQAVVIYFFNTAHKTGDTWKHGEAVHWVLWQNRVATPIAVWLRNHEPSFFSPLATWGLLCVLILLPHWRRQARTAALLLAVGLHLGIALTMTLGPFSYAMIGLVFLLSPVENLEWLSQRMIRQPAPVTVAYDPRHAGARLIARLLASLDGQGQLRFRRKLKVERLARASGAKLFAARSGDGPWERGAGAVATAAGGLPLVGRPLAWLLATGPLLDGLAAMLAPRSHGQAPAPSSQLVSREPRMGRAGWYGRELAAVMFMTAVGIQISNDNAAVPAWLKVRQPAALEPLITYPRVLQGWRMFAPDAPRDDGMLVVDGLTADGRHLDPFTGRTTDFEVGFREPVPEGAPLCDYLFGMHFEGNQRFHRGLKDYLLAWQRIEKRPLNDRIQSFEVYWVSHQAPPPGSTTPYAMKKELVMSSRD